MSAPPPAAEQSSPAQKAHAANNTGHKQTKPEAQQPTVGTTAEDTKHSEQQYYCVTPSVSYATPSSPLLQTTTRYHASNYLMQAWTPTTQTQDAACAPHATTERQHTTNQEDGTPHTNHHT